MAKEDNFNLELKPTLYVQCRGDWVVLNLRKLRTKEVIMSKFKSDKDFDKAVKAGTILGFFDEVSGLGMYQYIDLQKMTYATEEDLVEKPILDFTYSLNEFNSPFLMLDWLQQIKIKQQTLESENFNLSQKNDEFVLKINTLTNELEIIRKDKESLLDSCNELEGAKLKVDLKLESAVQTIENLTNQIEVDENEIETLQSDKLLLNEKIEYLQSFENKYIETNISLDIANENVKSLNGTISDFKELIDDLNAQMMILKNDLRTAQGRNEILETENKSLNVLLQRTNESKIFSVLENMQSKIDELASKRQTENQ